jgi:hypothetical protein
LVPRATRFYEDPAVVDAIPELATGWYDRYIPSSAH